VAAILAIGTAVLFSPATGYGFLQFDDNDYVTENPAVRQGLTWAAVRLAFGATHAANWHPLTWLSHMLDVSLFGLDPGPHHAVNVLLHAANAAILMLALSRLTGSTWRSAAVAALFAVHPLHVESVAWISERKDVLSTLFGFLMLWAYARHAERPGPGRVALVALMLALSLLAKQTWVTAPFLLLLLDFWPLRRVEGLVPAPEQPGPSVPRLSPARLVLEKLPLLALSAASSAMAIVAQGRWGAIQSAAELPLGARLANATISCVRYLGKTFWPSSLAAFYPYPAGGPSPGLGIAAAALLAALTALALWRARRLPWLAVGWLWFLGTLVPVIGIVQVGAQAMADRYTYVPLVGLFVAVVWSVAALARAAGERARWPVAVAGGVAVALLAALASRQLSYWRDQETLFRHALAVTEGNGRAQYLLSQALIVEGDLGEASAHALESVRLEPNNARYHKNLGYVLYRLGRVDEAVAAFERAVALWPGYAEAHGNLAIAYGRQGRIDDAMREMRLERELRAR
jgi:tetratricopeptide (TPR) repeat protein